MPHTVRYLIPYLKLAHGAYNLTVVILLIRQAVLGFRIRRARMSSAPIPFENVKRHRTRGPWLVAAAVLGFFAGITLALFDKGNLLEYPLHLFTGLAVVLCLLAVYILSRWIKGPSSQYRTPHMVLGVLVLSLSVIEIVLGLGILL